MVCNNKTNSSDINKLYTLYTDKNTAARPPAWIMQVCCACARAILAAVAWSIVYMAWGVRVMT